MTGDLRELLRPRVERGAALLDSVEPYWWKRIEEELRLEDCQRCVLGQVYGAYVDGVSSLFCDGSDLPWGAIDAAGEHGFNLIGGPLPYAVKSADAWRVLDELWLEAIAERRSS